jgi:hypothetical protein
MASIDDRPPHAAVDATAFATAQRFGDLEASGVVADNTSFEEVDLPPNDVSALTPPTSPSGVHPERVRKPKRFYYCLPMLIRYRFSVLSCFFLVFGALLLGVMLSAKMRDDGAGARGGLTVDDAPSDYNNG